VVGPVPVPVPVPVSMVEPQQPMVELGVLVGDLMELLSTASLVSDDDTFGGLEAASALGVLLRDLNTLLGAASAVVGGSRGLEAPTILPSFSQEPLVHVLAVSDGYADMMYGSFVRLSTFLEALKNDCQFSATTGSVPPSLDLSCLVLDLLNMMQHTTLMVSNGSITSEMKILCFQEDLEHLLSLTDPYMDNSAPCPIKQSYNLELLAKELATLVRCVSSSPETQDLEAFESLAELQVLIGDLELLTQHALSFIEATEPKSEDEKLQVQKMAFSSSIIGT